METNWREKATFIDEVVRHSTPRNLWGGNKLKLRDEKNLVVWILWKITDRENCVCTDPRAGESQQVRGNRERSGWLEPHEWVSECCEITVKSLFAVNHTMQNPGKWFEVYFKCSGKPLKDFEVVTWCTMICLMLFEKGLLVSLWMNFTGTDVKD